MYKKGLARAPPYNNMPRTALALDYGAPLEVSELGHTSEPDAHAFLRNCALGGSLSRGAYGVAFHLVRPPSIYNVETQVEWVIKLPCALLAGACYPRDNGWPPLRVESALKPLQTDDAERVSARQQFRQEFKNAEAILEPPLFRKLHSGGGRIQIMWNGNWQRLAHERQRWRSLSGYQHLHPVLHFDAAMPAIISARADGTLADFCRGHLPALSLTPDKDAPPLWYDFARQIVSAVTFILSNTPIAHLDIKPHNLFYTRVHGETPLLQLGDYGLCAPSQSSVSIQWVGSAPYNPPIETWQHVHFTYSDQSLFQMAATLLDTLSVASHSGLTNARTLKAQICQCAFDMDAIWNFKHNTALATVRSMLRVDPHEARDAHKMATHYETLRRQLQTPSNERKRPRE
jgi:hypothetical protein